jgi:small-conductance mechanosensitive channel
MEQRFLAASLAPVQRDGLVAFGILAAVALAAVALERVGFDLLRRLAARRADGIFAAVVHRAHEPARLIFPLAALEVTLPNVTVPHWFSDPAEEVLALGIIAAFGWVATALIFFAGDLAKRSYSLDVEDNLHARRVETRLDILTRTAVTLVLIVAAASMLMTFPPIRAVGATLLASAGLAGLAVGFATRPLLENLVAGVQIALTQPIRLDDVVIVESEYGRIERITATYVVVRLWDLRRMIVPLTYFIDKPFQNWTYDRAELIGSVFLYVDTSVPVQAIRDEVPRILATTPLFDGKVVNVAMTDAKESGTCEVRVLVSAVSSGALFDLRCLVRERLIDFLNSTYPDALPKTRVGLSSDASVTADDRSRDGFGASLPISR